MTKCAWCKSNNTKRLAAIVTQGTKEVDLSTLVGLLGIGGGGKSGAKLGLAGGKASTKGIIESSLAKKAKSLYPKKAGIFSLIFFGPVLLLTSIALFLEGGGAQIVGIILGVLFLNWGYKTIQNRKTYSQRLSEYKRTWYCFKCDRLSVSKI